MSNAPAALSAVSVCSFARSFLKEERPRLWPGVTAIEGYLCGTIQLYAKVSVHRRIAPLNPCAMIEQSETLRFGARCQNGTSRICGFRNICFYLIRLGLNL